MSAIPWLQLACQQAVGPSADVMLYAACDSGFALLLLSIPKPVDG